MRRVLILNVFLLAIIAVLVIQIVALWWGSDGAVDEVAAGKPKAQRASVRNSVRPPVPSDLVKGIADQDLFDLSRAAPAAGESKVVGGETPVRPLTIELLGVRIVGGEREALVKDQTQPKAEWYRPGEDIGGHRVGRIEPRAIVMVAPNGDEVTLPINVKYNQAGGAPSLGPAGVQAVVTPRPGAQAVTPMPRRTPAADIREKIERLREEARRRRADRAAARPR